MSIQQRVFQIDKAAWEQYGLTTYRANCRIAAALGCLGANRMQLCNMVGGGVQREL